MKKLLYVSLFLFTIITHPISEQSSGSCLPDNTDSISAVQLKSCLERDEIVLIDVREPAEYRHEHIKNALLVPMANLSLTSLQSPEAKPIIINCLGGKRSDQARKKLLELNPSLKVYTLQGGINAWKNEGFDTIKTAGFFLPLDRQTQFAAGFLCFSGVMLGTFVHPGFYALSGFVGLGLMNAGLTGWCGMGQLLAKMPWNQ